jgi:fatty acid-binding protein DegV
VTHPCAVVVHSGALLGPGGMDGAVVIPLRIAFADELLRDGIDITPEEFYARLLAGEQPTTSTPSPGEYLEAFQAAGAEHGVCLTIPDDLSTMYTGPGMVGFAALPVESRPAAEVDIERAGGCAAAAREGQ